MFVFFGCRVKLDIFELLGFAGTTNGMLYLVQHYTRQNTYSGVVKVMFGRKMEWFVDLVQLLYSFGACVGYAIIIGDELSLTLGQLLHPYVGIGSEFIYSLFSFGD